MPPVPSPSVPRSLDSAEAPAQQAPARTWFAHAFLGTVEAWSDFSLSDPESPTYEPSLSTQRDTLLGGRTTSYFFGAPQSV